MLDAMKSTKKVIKNIGFVLVYWLCAFVAMLGIAMFSRIEKFSPVATIFYSLVFLFYLLILVILLNRFNH